MLACAAAQTMLVSHYSQSHKVALALLPVLCQASAFSGALQSHRDKGAIHLLPRLLS
jgi:hypothetical protein